MHSSPRRTREMQDKAACWREVCGGPGLRIAVQRGRGLGMWQARSGSSSIERELALPSVQSVVSVGRSSVAR